MGIKAQARALAHLLDPKPQLSIEEAQKILLENLRPQEIQDWRHRLEAMPSERRSVARERGPMWLKSPEGQQWLNTA